MKLQFSPIIDIRLENSFFETNKRVDLPFVCYIQDIESGLIIGFVTPEREYGSVIGFKTLEECASARDRIDLKNYFAPDKVFCVLKNSDFTEGRGPMRLHKIFKTFMKAHDNVLKQDGIYGSPHRRKRQTGINIANEPYAYFRYNGYDIEIMKVE